MQGFGRGRLKELPLEYWLRVFGDFMTGFGRSMMIPFMLIYLKEAGNFSTWVVTLLTAVPQFFQLFGTSWGGVLADYYGRKPVMFTALVGSGLVLTLMLSPNYLVVYTGYVLFLVISNSYRPAAFAMITDVVPQDLHRDAFAILRTTANLGFALGPLVGSRLFFTHRSMTVSGTILAYALTTCTVFFMRETIEPLSKRSTASPDKGIFSKMQNPFQSFELLKRDKLLLWAVITGVLFLMAQLQMFTSLTVVVNDAFADQGRTLSYLLLINTAGVVVGQIFVTSLTRKIHFYALLSLAIGACALGWGAMILPIGPLRFYLTLILTTIGEMLMAAGYNPFIASLAQEGEVAQYMGFGQTSNILGQMIGPTIGAIGYDLGGQLGYVLILWGLLMATYFSLQVLKTKAESIQGDV
ncbi:MAG TPA: MFS transporter [Candidatus Deferrimicrobium sp.]|nr:MFS transporter [Candidatus Deferrimicrobium sp.]